MPAEAAPDLWRALLEAGVQPAGLGARDTLRLEAGLPLHGHELGPGITPLQAGLGWVVSWTKPTFRGREALAAEKERGVARQLRGIATEGRRPPRAECPVVVDGQVAGETTSGNFSPVLGHGIALAFLPPGVEDGAAVGGRSPWHGPPGHRRRHAVRPLGLMTASGPTAGRLERLEPGQVIVFGGDRTTTVPPDLAAAFAPGDRLVVVQETGALLHVPAADHALADQAVTAAHRAFLDMAGVEDAAITAVLRGVLPAARGRRCVRPDRRRQRGGRRAGQGRWAAAARAWCCRRRCGRTW